MSLFKKIKVQKQENKDNVLFIIDYNKVKKHMEFVHGMILSLAEKKLCLLLLDSNTFYTQKGGDIDNKVKGIREELDQQGLTYREIVTQEESSYKLLGFKTNSTVKKNCYKIGIEADLDKLEQLLALAAEENAFCYFPGSEDPAEELMNRFIEQKGDYDNLRKSFELSLFFDTFFKRIRIQSDLENAANVEEKINNYIKEFQKR